MEKIIYNISSYNRKDTLIKTINSIFDQCDVINVALNGYTEIPVELYDKKINLLITDNEKGDAYKFYFLSKYKGYYFTIDDDLIYPPNYSEFLINKIEQYKRKSIITLHSRKFNSYPISDYYGKGSNTIHFASENKEDVKVHFGGTGVMAFHTDLVDIDFDFFRYPNMADIWMGIYAKNNDIDIINISREKNFVQQQKIEDSIFSSSVKNNELQTSVINNLYGKPENVSSTKNKNETKLIIVSTFWNAEKFLTQNIDSLKKQYYTNFIAYYIDDMSTDNSFEVAKNAIGNDNRFTLIKNKEKKYKTKNFIDVIKNNETINSNDVIIELDGDDSLIDPFVLGLINKIYSDENIWICGSKWIDQHGRSMNYGRANADNPRSLPWNFSQMRTYRAFLFRSINLEDLKYNGEYYKAACDLGHGMPMLEMAGNEHYYFLDKVTYLYNWHDHQSYSNNNSSQDKNIQAKTAKHIYSLPRYQKIKLGNIELDKIEMEEPPQQQTNESMDVLLQVLGNEKSRINTSKLDLNKKREYINTFNRFTPPKKTKRK